MRDLPKLISEFNQSMHDHDREKVVNVVLKALDSSEVDIKTLYEHILAPYLNQISSNTQEQDMPIWEEHVSSSIVRTALEVSFPYVLKERDLHASPSGSRPKALVVCLEEDYHELGARMTTDFLTILGFDATFVGSNTPKKEIIRAVEAFKPQLLCISVTNYYHLAKLHTLVEELNSSPLKASYKIVLGGYAIKHSSNVEALLKADYFANSYSDLERIKEDLL